MAAVDRRQTHTPTRFVLVAETIPRPSSRAICAPKTHVLAFILETAGLGSRFLAVLAAASFALLALAAICFQLTKVCPNDALAFIDKRAISVAAIALVSPGFAVFSSARRSVSGSLAAIAIASAISPRASSRAWRVVPEFFSVLSAKP